MTKAATETEFEVGTQDGWGVLTPIGEIDGYWAPRFRDAIGELLAEHDQRLIVDLARVGFLDSTAIGVMIGAMKRARALHGDVRIVNPQPFVARVLEITGLHRVIASFTSTQEAAAAATPMGF